MTDLKKMASAGFGDMVKAVVDVERTLNWRAKNNPAYAQKAFERALELLDLTQEKATTFSRRREIAGLRESFVDFIFGENEFQSSEALWKKYFFYFTFAARKNL